MKNNVFELVYKCARPGSFKGGELDIQTMNILWALDGNRTLGEIARDDMYDPDELIQTVDRLAAIGLIEVLPGNGTVTDLNFVLFLTEELALQIGPIATFLVQDAAEAMGCDLTRFPIDKVPEFIDRLSKEIISVEAAENFKSKMAAQIATHNPLLGK